MAKPPDSAPPFKNDDFRVFRLKPLVFLVFLVALYLVLYMALPEKTLAAMKAAGDIALKLVIPLCLVAVVMTLFNVWLKPGHITRVMERCSGCRAGLYAMGAGVISMGPVYAWYPLLRNLRDKGIGNGLIAIFIGGRAIKPVYIPLMVSIFGWPYVFFLTLFTFAGAMIAGYLVGLLVKT